MNEKNSILEEEIELNEKEKISCDEQVESVKITNTEALNGEYVKTKNVKLRNTTSYIAKVSALSALAFVVMFLQFPIFPAFPFLEIDFSNVFSLIGGFVLNPLAAFIIECIKILCCIIIKGTMTGYVGELSNLIISLAFVLPPTIIYHYRKNFKVALVSLICSVLFGTFVACMSNNFIVFPLFLSKFGMGILQGKTLTNVIFTVVLPFNLIKQTTNAMFTLILYKKTASLLRRF